MKRNPTWDLILSKLRQTLSKEEEDSFDQWLKINANDQIFQHFERLWNQIQKEESNYEPDMESNWKKLSAKILQIPSERAEPEDQ